MAHHPTETCMLRMEVHPDSPPFYVDLNEKRWIETVAFNDIDEFLDWQENEADGNYVMLIDMIELI